jgi:type III pantothenate kinase
LLSFSFCKKSTLFTFTYRQSFYTLSKNCLQLLKLFFSHKKTCKDVLNIIKYFCFNLIDHQSNFKGEHFMVLAIDIGNTNIVFGCLDDKNVFFVSRISTDLSKTEDQYAIVLKNILELYDISFEHIEGAIIASVVPQLCQVMSLAVNKITKKNAMIVGPGIKTGLNIKIDNPAQLGSDLAVTAVAALAEYKKPVIIIDMGTATTITVVDQNGSYIGGAILPGVRISLDALTRSTAQLTGISFDAPKSIIGTNTFDAMRSGIIFGNASMIDGMIERMKEQLGYEVSVVATGGLSRFIVPHCKSKIYYDDLLMLKGLRIIYNKNI